MIVAPVERRVDPRELYEVVAREVAAVPVCFPIPTAYWEGSTQFTVRFGPSRFRDSEIAADIEQQLDVFVTLGFWTKAPLPAAGERVFQYTLTEVGEASYRGHPYAPRGSAQFCPPAERRLTGIVSTERGYADGLFVRFTYAGNDSPSWLRDDARRLLPRPLPTPAPDAEGSITLYRVWYRNRHPLENAPLSGDLETFCYDYIHNRREACGAQLR